MSLVTLLWNAIWSFCYFNLIFTYLVERPSLSMMPSIIFFTICLYLEIKLMLICWESKVKHLIQSSDDRKFLLSWMVIFLYFLTLIAMVNLESIISSQILLLVSNTFVLFPQIIENAIKCTWEGLNLYLAVGIVGSQSFIFFFIYLFELNFEKLEKGWDWFVLYLFVFLISIAILYL